MKKLLFALIFSFSAATANATLLNYSIETNVDASEIGGSSSEKLRFSFAIDSKTQEGPLFSGNPLLAQYSGLFALQMGAEAAVARGTLSIQNDIFGHDSIGFSANNIFGGPIGTLFGLPLELVHFGFHDSTQTVFSDDSIPTHLELKDFDFFASVGIQLGGITIFSAPDLIPTSQANISLTGPNFVPEPSSAALTILGFVVLLRLRMKKAIRN